jgi:hypothetical protein
MACGATPGAARRAPLGRRYSTSVASDLAIPDHRPDPQGQDDGPQERCRPQRRRAAPLHRRGPGDDEDHDREAARLGRRVLERRSGPVGPADRAHGQVRPARWDLRGGRPNPRGPRAVAPAGLEMRETGDLACANTGDSPQNASLTASAIASCTKLGSCSSRTCDSIRSRTSASSGSVSIPSSRPRSGSSRNASAYAAASSDFSGRRATSPSCNARAERSSRAAFWPIDATLSEAAQLAERLPVLGDAFDQICGERGA